MQLLKLLKFIRTGSARIGLGATGKQRETHILEAWVAEAKDDVSLNHHFWHVVSSQKNRMSPRFCLLEQVRIGHSRCATLVCELFSTECD